MFVRTVRRISLQLIAIAAVASLAACSNDSTPLEPTSARHVAAPSRASHDDSPPLETCRSGWYEVEGKWVCDQP